MVLVGGQGIINSSPKQVYISTSLSVQPVSPIDMTQPAVAYNISTGEVDWLRDTGTLAWRKARDFDIVGGFTPTLSGGNVINTQDAGRITNAALPTASSTYEGVILEVSGLTSDITPTSGPLSGITLNNGDFIICENSNGTYAWKKLEQNANDRTLSPRRNQGNATMSFDINAGQVMIDTRAINDLPQGYLAGSYYEFKQNATIGLTFSGVGTYSAVHTIRAWSGVGVPSDSSGGNNVYQYAYASDGKMYRRIGIISTNVWGPWISSDNEHLQSLTRVALTTLRTNNQLVPGRSYEITDHVQGRLVAGTTVTLLATSVNELSHDARVNTTYDNTSWFGLYDIDTALVYELTDNRGNVAKGPNGTEVANFDWGNTSYNNVVVDNSTLTVNIGNTAPKQNLTIKNGSSLNLTNFTGSINNFLVDIVGIVNMSGANGTWRYTEVKDGSTLNISNYTGGGDNYYNTIAGTSSVNFASRASQVIFRQCDLVTGTTVATGNTAVTNINQVHLHQGSITHQATALALTIQSGTKIESGGVVNLGTGTMTLTSCHITTSSTVQQGNTGTKTSNHTRLYASGASNVSNQGAVTMSSTNLIIDGASTFNTLAGSTSTITVNNSKISHGSLVTKSATSTGAVTIANSDINHTSSVNSDSSVTINATRLELGGASNVTATAGSGGSISISDTKLFGSSSVNKLAASTAGAINMNGGCVLTSSSFVQTSGTGTITLAQCEATGLSGWNITAGDRSYSFTRTTMRGVSRANLSGTGAFTDTINDYSIDNRGTLTISCSGAGNSILYGIISGLSGAMTLSGTTGGKSMNRIKLHDGSLNIPSNPNAGTYQLWNIFDAGAVTVNAHPAGTNIDCISVQSRSSLKINKTGVGNISGVQIHSYASVSITGAATSINELSVEIGAVNISGGSITTCSKKMNSTWTITGGSQNNTHHWNAVNKTSAVANTNRVDYLGLLSTVPIL